MTSDVSQDFSATESSVRGADVVFTIWIHDLFEAARDEGRHALEQHAASSPNPGRQVVVAAGLASEYLHTATILSVDPVLLADRRSKDSLLILSRHNREGLIDFGGLRTRSMDECVELVKTMFPATRIDTDATALAKLRNAAAHTAHVGDGDSTRALQHLVRIVDALEPILAPVTKRPFWPQDYSDAISSFRDRAAESIRQIIETRLVAARRRLDSVLFDLEDQDAEGVLRTLERRSRTLQGITRDHRCPACRRSGLLIYQSTVVISGSPRDESFEVSREGVPVEFFCPVCEFEADSEMIGSFPDMGERIELDLDYQDEILIDPDDVGWEDGIVDGDLAQPDEDAARGQ